MGHYLISYNLTGPLGAELTNLVKDYDLTIDCLYSDEITLASMVVGNPRYYGDSLSFLAH